MKTLIILSFVMLTLSSVAQVIVPDLSKKEDLQSLGIGKIFEKDNSIIKNIQITEVKEYGIVYLKNESTHDIAKETISRIEFLESKWGKIKIEFRLSFFEKLRASKLSDIILAIKTWVKILFLIFKVYRKMKIY